MEGEGDGEGVYRWREMVRVSKETLQLYVVKDFLY